MIDTQQLKERFCRYVRIWSQSEDEVADRFPSTPQQMDFARTLAADLEELGLAEVRLDEHGYVTASLAASPGCEERPVLGLLAHYDTYPGVSGKDVVPIVHRYEGGDIALPDDPEVVIAAEDNPELADFIGEEIITASGKTLLGADDKAGVAEIIEAVLWMMAHPEAQRPPIRLAFTPDEEVGMGTAHFDLEAFGAHVAYTMDGSVLGEVENETFCADSAAVRIRGRDVHPGFAKAKKMLNAARIAARFIECIPQGLSPECTEKREGFLHPIRLEADASTATITYLVRSFTVEGLQELETYLEILARSLEREFDGAAIEIEIKEQYRNMIYHLEKEPRAVAFALEAVRAAGIEPRLESIRGGTDGARLSEMGLPTPNLFAGGVGFHSQREWVAVRAMEKAVEVIVHLAGLWAAKG